MHTAAVVGDRHTWAASALHTTGGVAKILFVSGDEELAYVCQVVLEARGHEVEVVPDARRALARLPTFSPQLYVIEEKLGDGADGIELTELLRQRLHLTAPIILVSGAPGAEERARSAGANAFIPEPFMTNELLAAIDRLLGGEERRIA
jgi:DNA-binding response OmpR family regulator